jgi:hypothetical protein
MDYPEGKILNMRTVVEEDVPAAEDGAAAEMDRSWSSKIFLAVFFLAIALSLAATYWRIVVERDYDIVASADCDPYEEKCFVHVCNPDPNVDGTDCTGNLDDDTWYTKNIYRKAYNVPDCDPNDEDCKALECDENEEGCYFELCTEKNVPEGDSCNDPDQYAKDNPQEEEGDEAAVECAEGDQECLDSSEDEAEDETMDSEDGAADSEDSGAEAGDESIDGSCDPAGGVCPVPADGSGE